MSGLEGVGGGFSLRSVEEEVHDAVLAWVRGLTRVVLEELWGEEVDRICGPRWSPRSRGARAVRGGSRKIEILLGGEWVEIRRPRIRARSGREQVLADVQRAEERDLLSAEALESILTGATTGYTPSPAPDDTFIGRLTEQVANRLAAAIWRPLTEIGPVLVIGGLAFRSLSIVGCVQIGAAGDRELIALRAGSCSDNATAENFLLDLARRCPGIDFRGKLIVAADADALQASIRDQFGEAVPRQRCVVQSMRRILAPLPPNVQPLVLEKLKAAYASRDWAAARSGLDAIAHELEAEYPTTAGLIRAVTEDTLTLQRIGMMPEIAARRGGVHPLQADFK